MTKEKLRLRQTEMKSRGPKDYTRKRHSVYLVLCVATGQLYVGYTARGLRARWKDHVWAAQTGAAGRLYDAIRQHGANAFEMLTIGRSHDAGIARDLESRCIARWQLVSRGLNMVP